MAIDTNETRKRLNKIYDDVADTRDDEPKNTAPKAKHHKSTVAVTLAGLATAAALGAVGGAQIHNNDKFNDASQDGVVATLDDDNAVLGEGHTYDEVKSIRDSKASLLSIIDEKLEKVDHSYHYTPEGKSWADETLDEQDKLNAQKQYINEEIKILDSILSQEALDNDNILSDESSELLEDYYDLVENGEVEVQVAFEDVATARANTIYTVKSFMEADEGVSVSYDKLSKIYGTPDVYFVFDNMDAFEDDIKNGSDSYTLYIEEEHENDAKTSIFDEIDHVQNAKDNISGQWGEVVLTKVKERVITKAPEVKTPAPVVTPAPEVKTPTPVVVTPEPTPEPIPEPIPDPIPDPDPQPDPIPDPVTPKKEGAEDTKHPVPNAEDHQAQPAPEQTVDDHQGQTKPETMSATEETQGEVIDSTSVTPTKEEAQEQTFGDTVDTVDMDAIYKEAIDEVFGDDLDSTYVEPAAQEATVAEEETFGDEL